MADAADDTIPCENCETPIKLEDWSEHLRECLHGNKREKKRKKHEDNNSQVDGIPCESCQSIISLDDWESHTKPCLEKHRVQIKNIKNDTDELAANVIPCEFCDKPINIHDWEWHSRQCQNTRKNSTANSQKNDNDSTDVLIPCEYCAAQVSINDWTSHTEKCANAEKKRLEDIMSVVENDPNANRIPCEYCDKSFPFRSIEKHQAECRQKLYESNTGFGQIFGGGFPFPKTWDLSSPNNLSRYIIQPDTEEYKFVEDNFHKTLPSNQIVQIERIQNRRWYRQYEAHKDDFIERYGNSTEQWLFHGCKSQSTDAIIKDCFNRSHAVRCAAGQGIYFAAQAATSLSYTQPDTNNTRHMFMARVLVGKTAAGNQSTRVCPPGYDTTGGGNVFVTYHDAQAYGEYLIQFR